MKPTQQFNFFSPENNFLLTREWGGQLPPCPLQLFQKDKAAKVDSKTTNFGFLESISLGLVSKKKTVHTSETDSAIQFFFTRKQFLIDT